MCSPIECLYSTMGGVKMGVFLAQLWEPPIHNHFDSPLRAFSQTCVKLKWKSSTLLPSLNNLTIESELPLYVNVRNYVFHLQAKHALFEEIKEINQQLIDTMVDLKSSHSTKYYTSPIHNNGLNQILLKIYFQNPTSKHGLWPLKSNPTQFQLKFSF